MGTRFDSATSIPRRTVSRVTKVLFFLASLVMTGWMGFVSFKYGFSCSLGMGEGFDCRIISPYFLVSTLALFVFSFFVFSLLNDIKKFIVVSFVALLLFLAGPWTLQWIYYNLPKETRLNLDGYSVKSCEQKRSTKGEWEADLCFVKYAAYMNDVRICDYISAELEREQCYFKDTGYGARGTYKANLTPADCDRINDEYQNQSCKNYFNVRDSKMIGKCEDIQEGFDRWFCWGSVASNASHDSFRKGDIDFRANYAVEYQPSDCASVSNNYLRDFCYFKYVGSVNEESKNVMSLREVELCDKIENSMMKRDCKDGWGVVSGQIK